MSTKRELLEQLRSYGFPKKTPVTQKNLQRFIKERSKIAYRYTPEFRHKVHEDGSHTWVIKCTPRATIIESASTSHMAHLTATVHACAVTTDPNLTR